MADDPSIARIDAYRARQVGEMLVNQVNAEFLAEQEDVILELSKFDGKELLNGFTAKHSKFATTPFDVLGERLKLYPGGVTIWSGFPGAGKTTLIRQMICHTLARGSSVFLASLEEDPADVIVRLAAVAAGTMEPNAHQVQWFIDAYGKRFRLWGVIGVAQHLRLLAMVRQLASQGIRHAFVDSLMCLDVRNDDFESQRRFANLLGATAKATKVHIHLVAHPRKLVSSDQELDLNDVAGAREIGGIADNVVFVRRAANETQDPSAVATAMRIGIRKQRHGSGWMGDISGWFNRDYRQFHHEQFPMKCTRYLPDDAYARSAKIEELPI